MFDGDIRMLFVKSGIIGGGCCPTLKNHDRAATKLEFLRLEIVNCMSRLYTSRELRLREKC